MGRKPVSLLSKTPQDIYELHREEMQARLTPSSLLAQQIIIESRCRTDLGDIKPLAQSIDDIGLLHPIVVNSSHRLIAGERRLAACKSLGWETVPARVVKTLDDATAALKAERDENTCRKDFTPSEAVALGERLEEIYREEAEKNAEAGRKLGGETSGKGRSKNDSSVETFHKAKAGTKTRDRVGEAVGMSGRTYEKAKAIVNSGDKNLIAKMDRTGKVNGVHKRLKVQNQIAEIRKEPPPLPTGPFRVLVVDPPWEYWKRKDDPSHRATCPYPSMSIEEIKGLEIKEMSHEDAVLWLWTTNSHLPESFSIVDAWGFQYKTTLTWVKDRMGCGDWLSGKTEHCLMCTRGKPTINLTNQTTAIKAPLREHSQKPEEFYELVEALCPGSKTELFSRTNRDGWVSHGDEAGKLK